MKKFSVVKFGGGLLDPKGKSIPTILERIKELKSKDDLGPIVVFSAPTGFTDDGSVEESYSEPAYGLFKIGLGRGCTMRPRGSQRPHYNRRVVHSG